MRTDAASLNAILARPGYSLPGLAPVAPQAHSLVLPYPPSPRKSRPRGVNAKDFVAAWFMGREQRRRL